MAKRKLKTWTQEPEVETNEPGRLKTVEAVKEFVLAGNATFTLESVRTGERFTFRVKAVTNSSSAVSHFVNVLTEKNNDDDYAYKYLGELRNHISSGLTYTHGKKSKIGADTPSAKAFDWFAKWVLHDERMSDLVKVWHEGRCGRCDRKLTVPESIARGIGPECATRGK